MPSSGEIRVGIGGWTFEPWRNNFYPQGLPQKRELEYASRHVTAIEINGTFYRTQTPATFAKWRDETPDGFVFAIKALRYITMRRVLAEGGESINSFINSGLAELGDKLGPILWQFAPTKKFDAEDFARFLESIPEKAGGIKLRHALEVRHSSFHTSEFVALAHAHNAAIVYPDTDEYPASADLTADFVYARLMKAQAKIATGYSLKSLKEWTQRAQTWAQGGEPADLPHIDKKKAPAKPRDVFMFFINGAKERAPAGAGEMLKLLGKR
ncbi:MAG: hypothetical protein JWN94_2101 [Betaproteobacteria bacterium]|nr:hypothetical protein [Betaproteobacteria bacterium]